MNIACAHALSRWTPLQSLIRWLLPQEPMAPSLRAAPSASLVAKNKPTTGLLQTRRTTVAEPCSRLVRRPLRIVRVMEVGQARSQVGRMVISGRLADVCAELDRLAACDTPAR